MVITNQLTKKQLQNRDSLITASLRPDGSPFLITDEYPTVLQHTSTENSYCLLKGSTVAAHANLWPRTLISVDKLQSYEIGLIGNVATDERYRGQGLMKQLLDHLKEKAKIQKLDALILWSDLLQFYQKLGFTSFGRERRYQIVRKKIQSTGCSTRQFFPISAKELRPSELKKMLELRPHTGMTLERKQSEFQALLSIPATHIYVSYQDSELSGFAILGRGCDMIGAIHEWGVRKASDVHVMVSDILDDLKQEKILLLAPAKMDSNLEKYAKEASESLEDCHMALHMGLSQRFIASTSHKDTFIWGLDSI